MIYCRLSLYMLCGGRRKKEARENLKKSRKKGEKEEEGKELFSALALPVTSCKTTYVPSDLCPLNTSYY